MIGAQRERKLKRQAELTLWSALDTEGSREPFEVI